MTIAQSYKKISIVNILIIIFFIVLIILAFLLVFFYNSVVNFENKIYLKENEIKKIETDIAELKEDLFNILSGDNLQKIASENGLVIEKNPEYFEIKSQQWQVGLNF
ncbi:MAG: hypothetical protein RMK17_01590 [bacterium]|nr:hypothetical protein [Patescibacteria group bacterium]MDW8279840.1 hypothetical protein [bacterium]